MAFILHNCWYIPYPDNYKHSKFPWNWMISILLDNLLISKTNCNVFYHWQAKVSPSWWAPDVMPTSKERIFVCLRQAQFTGNGCFSHMHSNYGRQSSALEKNLLSKCFLELFLHHRWWKAVVGAGAGKSITLFLVEMQTLHRLGLVNGWSINNMEINSNVCWKTLKLFLLEQLINVLVFPYSLG